MRTQAHEHMKCKRSRCEGAVQELPQTYLSDPPSKKFPTCFLRGFYLLGSLRRAKPQPGGDWPAPTIHKLPNGALELCNPPRHQRVLPPAESQITRSSQHHRQGPSAPEVALLPAKIMSRSHIPTITLQSIVGSWLPCLMTVDMLKLCFDSHTRTRQAPRYV